MNLTSVTYLFGDIS